MFYLEKAKCKGVFFQIILFFSLGMASLVIQASEKKMNDKKVALRKEIRDLIRALPSEDLHKLLLEINTVGKINTVEMKASEEKIVKFIANFINEKLEEKHKKESVSKEDIDKSFKGVITEDDLKFENMALLKHCLKFLKFRLHPDDKDQNEKGLFSQGFQTIENWINYLKEKTTNVNNENAPQYSETTFEEELKNNLAKKKVICTFTNGNMEHNIYSLRNCHKITIKSSKINDLYYKKVSRFRLHCSNDVFKDIIDYLFAESEEDEEGLLLNFLNNNNINYLIELVNTYKYLEIVQAANSLSLWDKIYTKIVTSDMFTPQFIENKLGEVSDNTKTDLLKALFANLVDKNNTIFINELLKKYSTFKSLIEDKNLFYLRSPSLPIFKTLNNNCNFKEIVQEEKDRFPLCFVHREKVEQYYRVYEKSVNKVYEDIIKVSREELNSLKKVSNYVKKNNSKIIDISKFDFDTFNLMFKIINNYAQKKVISLNEQQEFKLLVDNTIYQLEKFHMNAFSNVINMIVIFKLFKITDQELKNFFTYKESDIVTDCVKYLRKNANKRIYAGDNGIAIDFKNNFNTNVFLDFKKNINNEKKYINSIINLVLKDFISESNKDKNSIKQKNVFGGLKGVLEKRLEIKRLKLREPKISLKKSKINSINEIDTKEPSSNNNPYIRIKER